MKKWMATLVCAGVMAFAAGCDVGPGADLDLSTSEQAVTEYWATQHISLASGMSVKWLQETTVVFPQNKTVRYGKNETVTLPDGIAVYLPYAGAFAFADGTIDHYPDGTTLTMGKAEATAVAVSQPDSGSHDSGCDNHNDSCIYWESIGECSKNPGYMLTECCKSCYHAYDPNNPNDPYHPDNPNPGYHGQSGGAWASAHSSSSVSGSGHASASASASVGPDGKASTSTSASASGGGHASASASASSSATPGWPWWPKK